MVKNKIIPSDIQEAADKYIGYPHEVDEGVSTSMRRDAYADGMLAERERWLSCALSGKVVFHGVAAFIECKTVELSDFLRSRFKGGDNVRMIITKKEDEK